MLIPDRIKYFVAGLFFLVACNSNSLKQGEASDAPFWAVADSTYVVNDSLPVADSTNVRGVTH